MGENNPRLTVRTFAMSHAMMPDQVVEDNIAPIGTDLFLHHITRSCCFWLIFNVKSVCDGDFKFAISSVSVTFRERQLDGVCGVGRTIIARAHSVDENASAARPGALGEKRRVRFCLVDCYCALERAGRILTTKVARIRVGKAAQRTTHKGLARGNISAGVTDEKILLFK